jgi:murein DD-endopeptidase MepM/ murein hydrolase activator NlpD
MMIDEKLQKKRISRGRWKKKQNLPADLIYTGSLLLLALLCFFLLRPAASETFVFGLNGLIGASNQGSPRTSSPNPSSTPIPTTTDAEGKQMINKLYWPFAGAGEEDIDEDGLFGSYRIHEDKTMHEGIDIGAVKNTPVDAAKDGEVIFAGPQGAYGKLVIVRHADGTETYYAHLNSYSVVVGDQVQQGQSIGGVGNTAYGEWADSFMEDHLHFEYWVNGEPVDPLVYLSTGQ